MHRPDDEVRFEGIHCALAIRRPAPGVVILVIEGTDTGELGDAPFRELAADVAGDERLELFIDAGATRSASIEVSAEWARWLGDHRNRFRHISMLTGSPFIRLTADFVRRFADLGDIMRLYTVRDVFEGALANAVANSLDEPGRG